MFILSNMGKDHEFLEAARNGNITVVEKVLSQKAKRTGPLASLRRGPGANVQDSSGYSALHHAALNGHTDVVRLLLAHDASSNLPDSRGSSPLHLAAWAGHQDIVKLFLIHPHRPANPNLQTVDNETPLHCAAQHGHTGALTTLLAHGADPNVTNNRNETPLDLAAQYGRLQAVQMLIRAHPELLLAFKLATTTKTPISSSSSKLSSATHHNIQHIVDHSPLHLASRNGHKNVVEVLLAAGVNVNLLTPSGTALHEAALCGKDIVVRTLLNSGVDLEATDCDGRTALNILEQFPPHVTKGIVSVINNYRNSFIYDSENDDRRDNNAHKIYNQSTITTPMSLGSSYENNRNSPVHNYCNSHHDITTSPSSSIGSLGPPSPSPRPRASTGDLPEFYIQMAPIKQQKHKQLNHQQIQQHQYQQLQHQQKYQQHQHCKPAAPKKPPRRNLSVSPTHLQPHQQYSHLMSLSCDGGYTDNSDNNKKSSTSSGYEYIFMARTGQQRQQQNDDKFNRAYSIDQYVEMTAPKSFSIGKNKANFTNNQLSSSLSSTSGIDEDSIIIGCGGGGSSGCGSVNDGNDIGNIEIDYISSSSPTMNHHQYENTTIATLKSYNPNRKLKRNRENYEQFTIDFNKDKSNDNISPKSTIQYDIPQSPTNYKQPPTPEHPPPSAIQAEKSVLERIRPLSQEYKRRSGLHQQNVIMMETGTSPPEQLCSSLCASSGSISSSVSVSDRSLSTDCVEEYVGDVPFAGLFKGSTVTLNNTNFIHPQNQQNPQSLMATFATSSSSSSPPPPPPSHNTQQHQQSSKISPTPSTTYNNNLNNKLIMNQGRNHHERPKTLLQSLQFSLNDQKLFKNSYYHQQQQQQQQLQQQQQYTKARSLSFAAGCSTSMIGDNNHSIIGDIIHDKKFDNKQDKRQQESTTTIVTKTNDFLSYDDELSKINKKFNLKLNSKCKKLFGNNKLVKQYQQQKTQRQQQQQQQEQQQRQQQQNQQQIKNVKNINDDGTVDIVDQQHQQNQQQQKNEIVENFDRNSKNLKKLNNKFDDIDEMDIIIDENIGDIIVIDDDDDDDDDRGEKVLSPFNEEEAWAKISEIMESFGSGILIDNNDGDGNGDDDGGCEIGDDKKQQRQQLLADSGRNDGINKLHKLLIDNNLGNFEKCLIDNGFDHIDFLNGILDENDLITLNIIGLDKDNFINLIKLLPKPQSLPCLQKQTQINCNNVKTTNSDEKYDVDDIVDGDNGGGGGIGDNVNIENNISDCNVIGESSTKQNNNINNNINNKTTKLNKNDKITTKNHTNLLINNNNSSTTTTILLSVDQWLKSLHLSEYIENFKKNLYTNMEMIYRIWEIELETVLEINKLGHRKRILYSLINNRLTMKTARTTTIDQLNNDFKLLKADLNDLEQQQQQKPNQSTAKTTTTTATIPVTLPNSSSSNIGIRHNNNKKNRAPKPPIRATSLEIRAPSELLLGLPSNLRTQWRHSANILITSSVKYDVYYLGSTVVKELRGTESTRKSIQKLKRDDHRSTTNIENNINYTQHHHPQPVRLSISNRGVEFIDIESQNPICEHEIRNINCACQDADDLCHFAYITKDSDVMNTHYCHVFNVDSMDLATEIILTLGQAFEVAYQLALRETSPKTPTIMR